MYVVTMADICLIVQKGEIILYFGILKKQSTKKLNWHCIKIKIILSSIDATMHPAGT